MQRIDSQGQVANQLIRLNYVLFCLLALMWSGSFINIKLVVDVMPPVFCAMMRVLISLIGLTFIFTAARRRFWAYSEGGWLIWVAGIFTQALPFALLFYGERFVAPALASIINSTVSLWALLLGACLYRDTTQWTPLKVGGLLLGFLGIVIIFMPSISKGESSLIGIATIMGMSISYAIGSLFTQHVIYPKIKASFEANLFQQHVASLAALIVASLAFETWPTISELSDVKVITAFLYLGLVATSIAWIIYFYLIREWGAVRTASVMYIVPVLAILWDLLFLHIVPSYSELIGAAAILSGVVLIQWVRKAPKR